MAFKTILSGKGYNQTVVTAFFREHGIAAPFYEFRFHPERKWRFDICWGVPIKLAIEVQGGIFTGGAHVRGESMLREFEKLNEAAAMGWAVLFVTPKTLCMRETADLVRRCLLL